MEPSLRFRNTCGVTHQTTAGSSLQTLTIFVRQTKFQTAQQISEAYHKVHISLTPELESRVKAKVETGLYNNASEVIREALRFMETHEDWILEVKLAHLRDQLKLGTDQLDNSESTAITSKASLDAFFEKIQHLY